MTIKNRIFGSEKDDLGDVLWPYGENQGKGCEPTRQRTRGYSGGSYFSPEQAAERLHQRMQVLSLESRVARLEKSHESTELKSAPKNSQSANSSSCIVPIQSLATSEFILIMPILAVVQDEDGAFVASFFDANVNASGDTQLDAIEALKERLIITFRLYTERESELGELPRRQLSVLREFIKAE